MFLTTLMFHNSCTAAAKEGRTPRGKKWQNDRGAALLSRLGRVGLLHPLHEDTICRIMSNTMTRKPYDPQ